jgi:hypothetical protein
MATKTQRAQALADALTNRVTPQAQVTQLADAFVSLGNMDPAAMTLAQKADVLLAEFRRFATATIKRAEGEKVAAAATAANNANIDSNFAEAP